MRNSIFKQIVLIAASLSFMAGCPQLYASAISAQSILQITGITQNQHINENTQYSITIKNTSKYDITTLDGIIFQGNNNEMSKFKYINGCGDSLAAGASCTRVAA